MTKSINITHIDSQNIDEKIGERKHVDLEHEKLFKEYNIDPNRLNNETTHPIPKEWIPEILVNVINSVEIKPFNIQHDKNNKIYILTFENKELVDKFDNQFSQNIFNCINQFIESKGLNVKTFQRNIVFTKNVDVLKITIEY